MKHKLSVYQRMQQKLALTPMMRQSMRVLSMSTKELHEYIDSLLEKNPFLKKSALKTGTGKDYPRQTRPGEADDYRYNNIASEEDPREALIAQIRMLDLADDAQRAAEYLISEIDDNGYIKTETETAAKDLSLPMELVEEVLGIIQRMEPAGIGARDVRECLMLQLERRGMADSLEYSIVDGCMMELARNDVAKIRQLTGHEGVSIKNAIKNIKKLNPKPASSMLSKAAAPVVPDLIATPAEKDIYLELNREWAPQLRLYNPYEEKLEVIKDPEAKEFLKKNMSDAKGLIDSLKRREETMCKVADCILRHQRENLSGDMTGIKALTMREVADELNVHLSTISRTVSNKYVEINGKVVPLKALLSHAIKNGENGHTSKTRVKGRIREIIAKEEKQSPLSDKAIADTLEKESTPIKRRTVAKYRDSLKILPTHLRRKRD